MSNTGSSRAAEAVSLDTIPAPPGPESASVQLSIPVGTLLAERYRIDQLLGEGGMGQVYRAEHVHMQKAVAVKVLHRELTAQAEIVARFEREAVAAARIEHANVAAATDFGRLQDGSFYLVLEFVEGQSLADVLAANGRLPEQRALRITRQICDALCAAHAAGIIHRDLKPDNVMLVARDDAMDMVKVLDFGIAKIQNDDRSEQTALTQAGTVFGTPEYMAPEQAQGNVVDARSDLYTLGMILYEMLSGSSAFRDSELVVVLTRQLTAEPPALPADVSPEVSELVMTLLRKNPDERVESALELLRRLDGLLEESESASGIRPVSRPGSLADAGAVLSDVAAQVQSRGREVVALHAPKLKRTLQSRVPLGRVTLPVWGLIAGLSLVLVGLSWLFSASESESESDQRGATTPAAVAQAKPKAPRLQPLIAEAERGDREALAKLRPLAGGHVEAWLALGHGYHSIQHHAASLKAYRKAVTLHASRARSARTLADVRNIADESEHVEAALLLADDLGPDGIDLIFDVWQSAKANPKRKAAAEAAQARLALKSVLAKASPALRVALDLEAAKGCAAFKRIMPGAVKHADARSEAKLKRLTHTSGCGFLSLRDCYSCLRGTSQLKQALERARTTPAPQFSRVD